MRVTLAWLLLALGACASAPVPARPPREPAPTQAQVPKDETLARFDVEARAIAPLVESAWVKDFLRATSLLPPASPRVLHHDKNKERYYTAAEYAALAPESREGLVEEKGASELFYETHYGTPLAYARALDLAAKAGLTSVRGKRILDFGYGTVGHLRLLAALGAEAVGVDVDPFLAALYSEPGDRGRFPAGDADAGSVKLLDGRFPKDRAVVDAIGGGYHLILSKNVLKNGYLHPAEPVSARQHFDLGVTDEAFVKAVYDALAPGGIFLVYNICPPPAAPGGKYIPWADGRFPFPRAMLDKRGFEVLAFDVDDGPKMRAFAKAFKWDEEMKADLEEAIFVWYTLARRKGSS